MSRSNDRTNHKNLGLTRYICWRRSKGPRDYQEDNLNFYIMGNRALFVVADGMGGHARGDLASKIVVDSFVDAFQKGDNLEEEEILKIGLRNSFMNVRNSGIDMGSTMVAGILKMENSGSYTFTFTWIGDSRIYVFTPRPHTPAKDIERGFAIGLPEDEIERNKKLWLITRDDSFVWGLYSTGEITFDEISLHPSKNQLQHSIHPKHSNYPERVEKVFLEEGDFIFLCTDGVWESFRVHRRMSDIFSEGSLSTIYKEFVKEIDIAIEEGLCDDNNTFVICQVSKNIFKKNTAPLPEDKLPKFRWKDKRRKIQFIVLLLFVLVVFSMFFFIYFKGGNGKGGKREVDKVKENIKRIIRDSYEKTKRKNTIEAYENFLNTCKNYEGVCGDFVKKYKKYAKKRLNVLKEEEDWKYAERRNTIKSYKGYIRTYPNGKYVSEAEKRIKDIENRIRNNKEEKAWEDAKDENTIESYKNYIKTYPNGKYVSEAEKRISEIEIKIRKDEEEKAWKEAENKDTIKSYKKYLKRYGKEGKYVKDAKEKIFEKIKQNILYKDKDIAIYKNNSKILEYLKEKKKNLIYLHEDSSKYFGGILDDFKIDTEEKKEIIKELNDGAFLISIKDGSKLVLNFKENCYLTVRSECENKKVKMKIYYNVKKSSDKEGDEIKIKIKKGYIVTIELIQSNEEKLSQTIKGGQKNTSKKVKESKNTKLSGSKKNRKGNKF